MKIEIPVLCSDFILLAVAFFFYFRIFHKVCTAGIAAMVFLVTLLLFSMNSIESNLAYSFEIMAIAGHFTPVTQC